LRANSYTLGTFQTAGIDSSSSPPSAWTRSPSKRLFDCACVLAVLPALIAAFLLIALAVRLTSRGPILFLQKRVGCCGRPFTIFKFRTLRCAYTAFAAGKPPFTPIGRFLRQWKLDELPQFANVLLGDMSLVGPRPKMREYEFRDPQCRPGITGAATVVFAREEALLERVPRLRLREFYHSKVMPAKYQLDAEYAARATFISDLKLLLGTALRRWDTRALATLLGADDLDPRPALLQIAAPTASHAPGMDQPATAEPSTAFPPAARAESSPG
jgi:lipopolysaccharide/colanic/teichoic acid biosynthesis glycosyltransferase